MAEGEDGGGSRDPKPSKKGVFSAIGVPPDPPTRLLVDIVPVKQTVDIVPVYAVDIVPVQIS